MRSLTFACAASLLAVSPPAHAQSENTVVLELFTSQGCSSCPPADALLAELADREGVIALALHVDYWDYLGWKDAFGLPGNTARQRAYAKKMHSRSIYTPQMIVQGEDRLIGHDAETIDLQIAAHQAQPAPVSLELERDGDELLIRIAALGPEALPADVYAVRFIPSVAIAIGAGENAGLDITYTNVVTSWETLGHWDGIAPLELTYPKPDADPLAVIVQRTKMGRVLTAATVP